MTDVNVLVVFYSRYGTAEQLGLAAGLGAIQGRANIRLRRLVDLADPATIAATPAWRDSLDRMNRDYVAPRPADPAWADAIVFVTPAAPSAELTRYVESLAGHTGIRGTLAAPLTAGHDDSALVPVYVAAARAGMIVVPPESGADDPVAAARSLGRRATDIARTLKSAAAVRDSTTSPPD